MSNEQKQNKMRTIFHNGVNLTRNIELEKRIKNEMKKINAMAHPSERLKFSDYCRRYFPYVTVVKNKVYTNY